MERVRFVIALFVGKILVFLTKLVSKERGTNIPGAYANKIKKDFIKGFKDVNYDKTIFITGTNGKSTTNNIIVHTLKTAGKTVTTNIEGANLIGGIATALIKNSSLSGKIKTEFLCFEVDERSLARIHEYLPAKNLCITNLQKDQVQRNGEPDYIYQKLKKVINKEMTLFLNNEEPRVKSYEDFLENVVYYGVDKNDTSFIKDGFYDVTLPCPKCNDKIKFEYYNVDNVGKFLCTNCNFKSENEPNVFIKNINFETKEFECDGHKYKVPYNQPFFMYNYALCIAICNKFEIPVDKQEEAFSTFKNISGRLETIQYGTKEIKYIRMKQENPETLQSAIDYISRDNKPKIFMLGLEQLEDFKPYYTNTFYAFDCNVDALNKSNIERYICFSEAVAYDSANRLIYAGVDKNKISILPTDSDSEILKELDKYDCDNVYLITWLHKYEELIKDVAKLKEMSEKNGK
ncbi:MAG: DUF1727 domain-containing protein [Clostridia bacterium]|nr:DUF1727 domain-containing protein [Clostridia bacterium]